MGVVLVGEKVKARPWPPPELVADLRIWKTKVVLKETVLLSGRRREGMEEGKKARPMTLVEVLVSWRTPEVVTAAVPSIVKLETPAKPLKMKLVLVF